VNERIGQVRTRQRKGFGPEWKVECEEGQERLRGEGKGRRSSKDTHQILPCPPPPILGISRFPLCMCTIILALVTLDVICECDFDCFLLVSPCSCRGGGDSQGQWVDPYRLARLFDMDSTRTAGFERVLMQLIPSTISSACRLYFVARSYPCIRAIAHWGLPIRYYPYCVIGTRCRC
jgi:hypothetical protein